MIAYSLTSLGSEDIGLLRIALLQREINAGRSNEELLETLVTHTLKPFSPLYAFIATGHSEGFFSLEAEYRGEAGLADTLAEIDPASDHPISLAMQSSHLICIASESPLHGNEVETIYLPLGNSRETRRVLVIGLTEPLVDKGQANAFFEVISQIFAKHFHDLTSKATPLLMLKAVQVAEGSTLADIKLSQRQLQIAEMIADGMTNRQISRQLGYTEATIRYETIKLYERLRVKNRAQASSRIRELLSK